MTLDIVLLYEPSNIASKSDVAGVFTVLLNSTSNATDKSFEPEIVMLSGL